MTSHEPAPPLACPAETPLLFDKSKRNSRDHGRLIVQPRHIAKAQRAVPGGQNTLLTMRSGDIGLREPDGTDELRQWGRRLTNEQRHGESVAEADTVR